MPLQIIRGDITELDVDAIVNPTNPQMDPGNPRMQRYRSIDALVRQKAGPEMDALCARLAPPELGFARITPGFRLKARHVIHTSGPIWQGGTFGEKALLRSCYQESLKLAMRSGCATVAFPLISSGAYGYPKDQVLRYAVEVISEFLADNEMDVLLCVNDRNSYEFSRTLYEDILHYISRNTKPLFSESSCTEADFAPAMPKMRPAAPKRAASRRLSAARRSTEQSLGKSLMEYLGHKDAGFADTLFAFIDSKGMSDVECYKKANIDKKLFSKIRSNPQYRPSKQTALAFAVALELNLDETHRLLRTLGMTLSHSTYFDMIVEYFIINGNYNVYDINEALFEFDQSLLGGVEK